MTDRGLPSVDGAPACPFVAFEHDRDERATSPDHRHRCYAEPRPAPRALAHQEAYCLSSAFPVCPTFQDWARREAARARGAGVGAAASAASTVIPSGHDPSQRNPPRDWSQPPPWAADDGGRGALGADEEDGEEAGAPGFVGGRPQPGSGLAGSAADRLAMGGGAGDPPEARPAWPASDDRGLARGATPDPAAGAGLAGAAGGLAAGRFGAAAASGGPRDDGADDAYYDDVRHRLDYSRAEDRGGHGDGERRSIFGRRDKRPKVGDSRRGRDDDEAPSWERPRRSEAYPTLKTRMGLPGMSRVALAAVALFAAAIAVFLLPGLVGVGGPSSPAGGGASPTPTAVASASVAPTPVPSPTPFVYTVAPKDTLTRIAKKFGVTIEQILAANPAIKDPNKLGIGDKIVIPTPAPSR